MAILLAGVAPVGVAAQTIVLADANIIDGTGGPVQQGMTIVIAGDTIASIVEGLYQGQGAAGGDSAQLHHLDGAWVLPGFWNMHTHLSIVFPDNHALDDELMPSKVIRAGLNAVDAGVDCLEHGYGLTDETIELMAEKGTFYDPTIICNLSDEYIREREARLAELGYSEDEEMVRLRTAVAYADERSPEFALRQRRALANAAEAGVKLLIGSDSMPIGEMGFLEMEQFVLSGVIVDLDAQLGTASYWDYFGPMDLPAGFLSEAEEAAGFQRGAAYYDQ